jgi:hypothetical protein
MQEIDPLGHALRIDAGAILVNATIVLVRRPSSIGRRPRPGPRAPDVQSSEAV